MTDRIRVRILHLSNDHYPTVMGGTEIFVARLIEAQQGLGHQVLWATHHTDGQGERRKIIDGVQVDLPPIVPGGRLTSLAGTATAAPGFQEVLEGFKPDVVHLHSFSQSCGLTHARAAKEAGCHVVVTVHAPGFSCANGTLIDMQGAICDGKLRPRRCTSCRLQQAGMPGPAAGLVSIQLGFGISTETPGRTAHVLTFRRLIEAFHAAWMELSSLADSIHVYAGWLEEMVVGHGIPRSKIHHVKTAGPPPLEARRRRPMEDGHLRLVYWGRCEQVKGIHLVVDAIRSMPPDAPVTLDIYTNGWERPYGQDLLRRIGEDRRIVRRDPLPQAEMTSALLAYDIAVVPSIWLETGPLTVLEAFAAGVPVVGSPIGGVGELLEGVEGCHTVDMTPSAWRETITALLQDTKVFSEFRAPIPPSFTDLARGLDRTAYRRPAPDGVPELA